MKKTIACLLLVASASLGGCEGVKQDLGIGAKRPPDEFSIYSRAPLSLPPDYGLRPPATATAASQAASPREAARQAMLGPSAAAASAQTASGATAASAAAATSPGLRSLMERTGANGAQSDIRTQVNRESTILADADQSFVERLMFWSKAEQRATVVDPGQEARRIQQNQAMNQPLTSGETPTIRRRPKALLEGIFN